MRFTVNLLIVFLIFLLSAPLSLTAAALSVTSPVIEVLDLPEPQISRIDSSGIVYLTITVDPDAKMNADFRASVTVTDGDGNVREVSPEIAVTDPENIKIPLYTELKAGDRITPVISNNNVKSTGADGTHTGGPTGSSSISIPGARTRTEYVITEAKPDRVVLERIVEVEKAVPQTFIVAGSTVDNVDVSPETSISEIITNNPEAIEIIAKEIPQEPTHTIDVNEGKIFINTKLILFFVIAALCVILFVVIIYLMYVNYANTGKLDQAQT